MPSPEEIEISLLSPAQYCVRMLEEGHTVQVTSANEIRAFCISNGRWCYRPSPKDEWMTTNASLKDVLAHVKQNPSEYFKNMTLTIIEDKP